MSSLFTEGEVINVIYDERYLIGHVYVFVFADEFVVHRLLKIEEDRLIFKGDLSLRAEKITKDSIIGRVKTRKVSLYRFFSMLYMEQNNYFVRAFGKFGLLLLKYFKSHLKSY